MTPGPPLVLAGAITPKTERLLDPDRSDKHSAERIAEVIAPHLRPGTVALDIGTGLGEIALRIAAGMPAGGRVFATDIDPAMIAQLEAAVQREQVTNVFPFLVSPAGDDPFYKQHQFDVVLLSRVYHRLVDPEHFFTQLRPSLRSTARVFIVHRNLEGDFSASTFPDTRAVVEIFRARGTAWPLYTRLSERTRAAVDASTGGDLKATAWNDLIAELNTLLEDRSLFWDLYRHHHTTQVDAEALATGAISYQTYRDRSLQFWADQFEPADRKLAQWLVAKLEESGAFRSRRPLSEAERSSLRMLNKLLIERTFAPRKRGQKLFGNVSYFAEKGTVIATLGRAGYTFVTEHRYPPTYHFLEFAVAGR